jgi:hypothetical protein
LAENAEEIIEQEREAERARVATIQVKQAMAVTALILRLSKHDSSVMAE